MSQEKWFNNAKCKAQEIKRLSVRSHAWAHETAIFLLVALTQITLGDNLGLDGSGEGYL